MYTNSKNKGNAFKKVAIPSNKAYFARMGELEAAASLYDDDGNVIPSAGNKVDQIAAMEAYDRMRQKEEDDARAAAAKKKDDA